jgi:hypothetical protein
MVIGSPKIVSCPSCKGSLLRSNILSANNFGAIYYSDGSISGRLWLDSLVIGKCSLCKNVIWLEELELIGEVKYPAWGLEEAFRIDRENEDKYGSIDQLTISELKQAVKFNIRSKNDEILLRKIVWQKCNRLEVMDKTEMQEYENNLWALYELLDTQDINNRILRAEILRNLGKFDECIFQLQKEHDEEAQTIIRKIIEAARNKNNKIIQLNDLFEKLPE